MAPGSVSACADESGSWVLEGHTLRLTSESGVSDDYDLRLFQEGKIGIEPLANFPIERDLVVVLDDFMEKLEALGPNPFKE